MTISIDRARQLLGGESVHLTDAEVQAKIDTMFALANRVYDILEKKKQAKSKNG